MTKAALPTFYYLFFGYFEPALTLIGAYLAIFTPGNYAADILPTKLEKLTQVVGDTIRGQMIIGGLGSCFFLLAMINISLFHTAKHHLSHSPALQEKVIKALLIPLAVADLSHIAVTLLPLPISLLLSPSQWTTTLHGNITITLLLFIVRSAYFIGIGRQPSCPTYGAGGKAQSRRKSHGQVEVPLAPSAVVSEKEGEEVVKAVEEVEKSPARRRGKKA